MIPVLKEALAINPGIRIIASPWTAPPWMKTNDTYSATSDGTLKTSDYAVYADYFVKFIKAYAANGITVDFVTPQNEPENETTNYPGMMFAPTDEATFITKDLIPALSEARLVTGILRMGSQLGRYGKDGGALPETTDCSISRDRSSGTAPADSRDGLALLQRQGHSNGPGGTGIS